MTPLTFPLGMFFGGAVPGWLFRDVPAGTHVDLAAGRCNGPAGSLVRSPATGLWAKAN